MHPAKRSPHKSAPTAPQEPFKGRHRSRTRAHKLSAGAAVFVEGLLTAPPAEVVGSRQNDRNNGPAQTLLGERPKNRARIKPAMLIRIETFDWNSLKQ